MHSTLLSTSEVFGADLASPQAPDDLFSTEGRKALHECFWSDPEDGLGLPVAIRPAAGDAESLFAEVATHFPASVPVTAYMRVLEQGSSSIGPGHVEAPPALGIHEIRSAVGLAIGELLTASLRAKVPAEHVSYGASRRTLSFAVYRTSALHGALLSDQVVERWLRTREIVGMESPMELAASIAWVSAMQRSPADASQLDGPQADLAEVVRGREPLAWFGDRLAASLSGIRSHAEAMRGPFDDRSAVFDRLVQVVTNRIPSGELGAVYIAYFCNEILPGSLSHFRLLAPFLNSYPTVVLWYCLFAGLSDRFEWREAFSGLGLKMTRDLLQPFSPGRRPTCDIAFGELEVLSRLPLKPEVVKPAHPRACFVEIFPGVEVVFRFGSDEEARAYGTYARQVPEARSEEHLSRDVVLRSLLREALDLIPDRQQPPRQAPALKRGRRQRGSE